LAWTEKEKIPTVPIPSTVFTHPVDSELEKYDTLRLGRELFVEHRCAKCHTLTTDKGIPELALDAPSFDDIGSRRHFAWMADWIVDPKAQRATAHMPKLLHGAKDKQDAQAIAAFLASLKSDQSGGTLKADGEMIEAGKTLAERLHCAGCHVLPDAPEKDSKKIALAHVNLKFQPGSLVAFLKNPGTHYAWTRMPNFKLADEEASQLGAYLSSGAPMAKQAAPPDDAGVIQRGKKLVQISGCLNCHGLKLENEFKGKALAELPAAKWNQGCLAASPGDDSKAPDFGFTGVEREALRAFGATDRVSLTRHVPAEFAERQTRLLNCRACHGQIDGFPPLEILGGKLKPEWAAQFIAGEIPYKPRAEKHPKGEPWLPARMPAFKAPAVWLAQGLAMQHGFPPKTPPEPAIDMDAATIGHKLVGKTGGYSCISCHGVGPMEAKEVFESEGINLAYSAARLLRPYFQRWLRDPLSIDPQTKMPKYFEDGRSPLTDFYDGDAEKQIDAVWQYLRLGDKMPPPNSGE
jgi:mono/diheme cytochrome c family protein